MFFSKPQGSSTAVIDINSSSVSAALVHFESGKAPSICYTVRIPLEQQGTNLAEETLLALAEIGNRLVREGAPALRAAAGEGRVDRVLVSLGSPWQEASVETKKIQKATPFTYTKSFTVDLLGPAVDVGGRSVTRTIIATILNGYLTPEPYGKQAKRAEIVVLSTSFESAIVDGAEKTFRSSFHTRDIQYVSFLEPAYRAVQSLYPHEKDFLLMCVAREATEVISVKRGHLIDTGAISCGATAFSKAEACVESLSGLLKEFATRHALPRTIFVLADDAITGTVRDTLNDPSLHALWLSDTPLAAVPIQATQFSGTVTTHGFAEGDARLAMLALTAERGS